MKNSDDFISKIQNDLNCQHYISECDTGFISNDKSLLTPCYFGGPILKRLNDASKVFQFYSNAGLQIGSPFTYRNAFDIHTIYIFPDCTVGFLHKDSTLVIVKASGMIETVFSPIADVVSSQSSYLGLTFLTKNGLIIFVNAFKKSVDITISVDPTITPVNVALHSLTNETFIIVSDDHNIYLKSRTNLQYLAGLDSLPQKLYVPIDGKIGIAVISTVGVVFPIDSSIQDHIPFVSLEECEIAGWCDDIFVSFSNSEISIFSNFNYIQTVRFDDLRYAFSDYKTIRVLTSQGLYVIVPEIKEITDFKSSPERDTINLLINSYKLYENKSIECLFNTENLDYSDVVEKMVRIAPYILDFDIQRTIMNTSSFVRSSTNSFSLNFSNFAEIIKNIKFINTMFLERKISFTTTPYMVSFLENNLFTDFYTFSVERLCNLLLYNEAARLSDFYGMSEAIVSEKWAVDYLSLKGQDSINFVINRLKSIPNVNYREIADNCLKRNFPSSAVTFANQLTCVKDRVQFLLPLSLKESIDSSINNLDGSSIVSVWKKTGQELSQMRDTILYCKWMNTKLPLEFNEFATYIYVFFEQNMKRTKSYGNDTKVLEAGLAAIPENDVYYKQACHSQIALNIMLDKKKSDKSSLSFTKSPRQYMKEAVINNDEEMFKKIKDKYHFSDQMSSVIRLQALASNEMWSQFDNATRSEPPCGWMTVCDIVFAAGNFEKAKNFVRMAPTSQQKLAMCDKLKMWTEARIMCEELKLNELTEKYRNLELASHL
ncbi:hypothetical protein TVAG_054650 [Trichomonas vaginalis G3]|uniref:Vps16 C-terminal domain-containing protein n=1 Tax=Trichomonas vaginalis (strain ATCC PRA-98 / G3) TaxID=412133 RepID=A2G4I2_TRIV3|nr:vacuolar protein sorting VPSs16 family [Trichomonas vaginalis G3]EAX87932.1 hypothetical protein TVAG_054650 [Trichomonas vaginalis G3]KAI5538349.1 vacuolar protein sorting VPSs16 family [Trichomonas vaginalis G3]|eukprot:XP_001300862.1 hypothetical protein [Trichomonas vaginalis G3]